MTDMAKPAKGVIKFTILVAHSFFIIIIYLVCLIYALELIRIFFKEKHFFRPNISLWDLGSWNVQFPYIHTLHMLYTKPGIAWLVVLETTMLRR